MSALIVTTANVLQSISDFLQTLVSPSFRPYLIVAITILVMLQVRKTA